jgi:hypothetical protein
MDDLFSYIHLASQKDVWALLLTIKYLFKMGDREGILMPRGEFTKRLAG